MVASYGVLTDANNARILDAIRNDSSLDYQRRVPAATQAGIDLTVKSLMEYRPAFNEFENALVNRIGAVVGRAQSWTNPLAEFKIGMLNYGDTIEEYQVGLLKAHTYDGNRDYMEKALFGRELPEVQANFHRVNRQEFYKVTVNEPMLKRAFLDDYGLSQYVSDLMNAPITSDNWDEFLLTVSLFAKYEAMGGFHRVNVPDVSDIASSDVEAKRALRIVRGVADTITFMSTLYNAARMPMAAKVEDLILFTSPEFKAAIDVEALAAAFNIDRAQVPTRIITIPAEHFGIDGCQAILTTKDFFVIADQLMENTSQPNPAGLSTNYFWHHWQVISASRFVPAVMFTTGPGDETIRVSSRITALSNIELADVDGETVTGVERGMTYQASVDITTDPVDAEDARLGVTWTVEGNESTRTQISQTGVLIVSGTEASETLTIVAQASGENRVALTINVSEPVAVTGDPTPSWPVIRDGDVEPDPEV